MALALPGGAALGFPRHCQSRLFRPRHGPTLCDQVALACLTVCPYKLQAIDLACERQAGVSPSCQLKVYCHDSRGFDCSGRDKWGVPSQLLRTTDPADKALGRTASYEVETLERPGVKVKPVFWPLLYFYGDSSCYVRIKDINISGVNLTLPDDAQQATQVCMYGLAWCCMPYRQ